MDSFTQILLGIATAEAIAGRELKNRTFIYGSILGSIPDFDLLIGSFLSSVDGIRIHRGLSHSILFFLLLSPLLGTLLFKLEKKKIRIFKAILLVFSCLLTHVLLDLFTAWGTQILWPLEERFALKTIFVVDPLYTIPLFISLLYVARSKTFHLRQKYLRYGLIFSTLYLSLACCIKLFALHQFQVALEHQNVTYREIIVKPTAFNMILWNANIKTNDGYLLGEYSLLDKKPITFTLYKNDSSAEKLIKHTVDYQKLVAISEGWFIISHQKDTVYFNDLRFGLLNNNPTHPQFAFSYKFIPLSHSNYSVQETPKQKRDGMLLLKKLRYRIQGN
ncbi:metal-dependent hydrolase [Flavobacterium sp.]|uniref:metal-dependent hydrolase n=1 Tax=Flavobacterium sp. TaxID=239 RepID=UPI00261CEB37|nr:metal-dependent hydrolase [Flavobacterium sp.]MDD3004762.1 metal-dependent hydrolase [Flavobacterium sp.]